MFVYCYSESHHQYTRLQPRTAHPLTRSGHVPLLQPVQASGQAIGEYECTLYYVHWVVISACICPTAGHSPSMFSWGNYKISPPTFCNDASLQR